MLPVDPHALEQMLRSASSAEVRFAPPASSDFATTGEAIAEFFRRIVSSRAALEHIIATAREHTKLIVDADQFFEDESRATDSNALRQRRMARADGCGPCRAGWSVARANAHAKRSAGSASPERFYT